MGRIFSRLALSTLFLIFLTPAGAQNKLVDSLHSAMKTVNHDTALTNIYLQLGDALYMSDPDTALHFWTQAKKLAENRSAAEKNEKIKKVYLNQMGAALANMGFVLDSQRKSAEAIKTYQEGLLILQKLDNKKLVGTCLNNIGLTYMHMSNTPKAIEYYNQALVLQEKIGDDNGMSATLNNLGFVLNDQGDVVKALEYYMKSLKIQEKLNQKRYVAILLINIGAIHGSQGDKKLELEYYERSLKLREEINDKWGIANSLNNIAGLMDKRGEKDKAIEYYKRSLAIKEEIKDREGIAYSLQQIGSLYFVAKDFDTALEYYSKALKIREEINDKKGEALSLVSVSNTKFKQNKVGEAQVYAEKSLKIAQELGFPNSIKNAAKALKRIYQTQKNFEKSLAMYELEIQMRDSITNEETKTISTKRQLEYQYQKMAAADSTKNFESQKVVKAQVEAQKAQLKQERTQRYAMLFGLLLLVVFAGFMFRTLRITRKQKDIIEVQKSMVEEHQKSIIDSIMYARRIQRSLLPTDKYIEKSINRLKKP